MVDLLILTSCINPPKQDFLKLNDVMDRYCQTVESIKFYIDSGVFNNIVVCDGSDYVLENDEIVLYAKNKNINLELLHFQQDFSKVKEYGKGYGEGEIMRYVIERSNLYKNAKNFIKITGRLKIINISNIVSKIKQGIDYFNLFPSKKLGCLDTRFYLVRKDTYENILIDSYKKVDDKNQYSYEFSFTDDLKVKNIKVYSFPEVPIFDGFSGTTNTQYTKDSYYYLEKYLTKLNLMNTKIAALSLVFLYGYNRIKNSIIHTYRD